MGSVAWGGVRGRNDNKAGVSSWRPGRRTVERTGLEGKNEISEGPGK